MCIRDRFFALLAVGLSVVEGTEAAEKSKVKSTVVKSKAAPVLKKSRSSHSVQRKAPAKIAVSYTHLDVYKRQSEAMAL